METTSSNYSTRELLNGLHRKQRQIVNQPDFLLHERLAVTHACEQSVMTRLSEGALADFLFRNEEAAARCLVGVLRFVRHQSGVALLNERRNVDNKAGPHVCVE